MYNIYEGTSPGGETLLQSTGTTATTFTSTGLTNGTTYYFRITAVTLAGEGPFSNEVSATPATVAGAPTTLTATASDAEVDLSWTSPANNGGDPVTGYNIYQGTSSAADTILTSTSTTATTFTSTGLTNGTTYYFRITAVTLAGEGPFSNEVSATPATVAGAPTTLTATASDAEVDLSWTTPANNGGDPVTGYNIYQGTSSGAETILTSTSTTATTFTSTGLTNGTTYYFKITAVTLAGEGPFLTRFRPRPLRCRAPRAGSARPPATREGSSTGQPRPTTEGQPSLPTTFTKAPRREPRPSCRALARLRRRSLSPASPMAPGTSSR